MPSGLGPSLPHSVAGLLGTLFGTFLIVANLPGPNQTRCGINMPNGSGFPVKRDLQMWLPRVFEATGQAPGERILLVRWPRVF